MVQARKFYLTVAGLENTKKEYRVLKSLRNSKIQGEVPKIWESEDLNPDYLCFQEDLSFLETRIAELENVLKNAKLIKAPSKKEQGIVMIGATVGVDIDDADKDEFTIVGTLEANPSLGKISNESPVGGALLGHRIGDVVVVSSPIKTRYTIKKIKYRVA